MRDLIIKAAVSEEEAARFEGRMAMLLALSGHEAAVLRANLNTVCVFIKLVLDIVEGQGTMGLDIAKQLEMLSEAASAADKLHDHTRECLGRAIFVSAGVDKGRLQ